MEQESKQDNKKYTLKVVVTSVTCTLVFIIVVLLLVLLGLKGCKGNNNGNELSSSQNIEEGYDNVKLNNQFIKIVDEERKAGGYDVTPTDIVAVTYTDNYPNSFDLYITAINGNTVYYYHLDNYMYPEGNKDSYSNFVEYLLLIDINTRLTPTSGIQSSGVTNESIGNDKGNYYVISYSDPLKHFSGFYFMDNMFNVYQYIDYVTGDNPFRDSVATQVVRATDCLYGYYQYLIQQ